MLFRSASVFEWTGQHDQHKNPSTKETDDDPPAVDTCQRNGTGHAKEAGSRAIAAKHGPAIEARRDFTAGNVKVGGGAGVLVAPPADVNDSDQAEEKD